MLGSSSGDGGGNDFSPQFHNYDARDLLGMIPNSNERDAAMDGYSNLLSIASDEQALGLGLGIRFGPFDQVRAFCDTVDVLGDRDYPIVPLNIPGAQIGYFSLGNYIVGFALRTVYDLTGNVVLSREEPVMLSIYSSDGNKHDQTISSELYGDAIKGLERLLEVFAHDPNQFQIDHGRPVISVYPTPNAYPAAVAYFEY